MRVLVVDDEKNIRRTFSLALESMDHEVSTAASGEKEVEALKRANFDVAFLDLKLSQESGLDVLEEIVRVSPRTVVVIITAYASVETAVEAMRRRAFDYLPKPCTPEQIRHVLSNVERTRKLERRVADLESRLVASGPEIDLATESSEMRKALETALKAAQSEATVLLLGETGTGKSVLAREIHRRSRRPEGAFITVSCPSLSKELLESELFGHVKGAFTGAYQDTMGKVAAADGGTLFLDEIGELTLAIQARLLRLLQERDYERVGENIPRHADVRIISATNRDLAKAVAEGAFREDLANFLDRQQRNTEESEKRVSALGQVMVAISRIALTILLSALTIIFLVVLISLKAFGFFGGVDFSITVLVALLVCLIPTTIGGLLSAIG
jgi:two-component system, NtrC family, response regulator AlgB